MADVVDPVALVAAATGLVAALPVAATAHAVSTTGSMRPVLRWWRNTTPKAVSASCAMATATIAFAVCQAIGWNTVTPGYWLFSVLGVGLSYADIRQRRLPHAAILVLWSTCAALFLMESVRIGQMTHLLEAIGCGLLVSLTMLITALAAPGQLGLGDVHFAGAVAFTLGWLRWDIAFAAIITAWIAQGAWGLIAIAKNRRRRLPLPFGPALFGAWVVATNIG